MKVLVFGGTGAIGTPVVDLLVQDGHDVFVTSRRDRNSENVNLTYLCGNAMDIDFVKSLLKNNQYDVLVDFMAYDTETFKERVEYLLNHVGRYFFFSSSRVYADNGLKPITEDCPRLLDYCNDAEYLETDEYALTKARQEDLLKNSKHKNWIIIRPYITYNTERLQLGVLEKEEWLYRALHGRTIVFTADIASKVTSLTYGLDTAYRIVKLVENGKNSNDQVYHIATAEKIKWDDIFELYIDTLTELLGRPQKYKLLPDADRQMKYTRYWQTKYDRLYNRIFDITKIQNATGRKDFTPIKEGLKKALTDFIQSKQEFRILDINWSLQGYFDKVCGEYTDLNDIPGNKNKLKYLVARYTNIQEHRNKK